MSELFVDAVDLEYCFRVRGCGYRVLSSTKALMTHSLGAYKAVTVLGVRLSTSQHSPLRRYYSVRNSLVVVRRYWRREPVATLRILRGMVQDVVLILALEHMRFRKLSAVVLGVKHFLCGRLGPLDEVTCNRLV
jgi:rhamnosyltransferase